MQRVLLSTLLVVGSGCSFVFMDRQPKSRDTCFESTALPWIDGFFGVSGVLSGIGAALDRTRGGTGLGVAALGALFLWSSSHGFSAASNCRNLDVDQPATGLDASPWVFDRRR